MRQAEEVMLGTRYMAWLQTAGRVSQLTVNQEPKATIASYSKKTRITASTEKAIIAANSPTSRENRPYHHEVLRDYIIQTRIWSPLAQSYSADESLASGIQENRRATPS